MFSKKTDLNTIINNDIKYVGPLSYRHLRIIGWIMMVLLQLSLVFAFVSSKFNSYEMVEMSSAFSTLSDNTAFFGQLAIPLFLLANFALILTSQENIKKLVIFHFSMAIVVYVLFILLYDRYFIGFASFLLKGLFEKESVKILADIFVRIYFTRYLTINVFVDLLMCSLLYFFLIYKPKHIKRKHLIYFRLLIIIPIAYEIASAIIKGLSLGAYLFELPIEVIPLLTSKPIVTFLAFLAIVLYLKNQERIFIKMGGQVDQYHSFLKTNRHSFQLSIITSIIFAIAGLIDLIVTIILLFVIGEINNIDINSLHAFRQVLKLVQPWGFAKGISLLFFSPVVLLFNYQKRYSLKSKNVDLLIPLGGIALMVFTLLEGFYQIMSL